MKQDILHGLIARFTDQHKDWFISSERAKLYHTYILVVFL
jgi:hypothetical protein